jgi:hypothetical protein
VSACSTTPARIVQLAVSKTLRSSVLTGMKLTQQYIDIASALRRLSPDLICALARLLGSSLDDVHVTLLLTPRTWREQLAEIGAMRVDRRGHLRPDPVVLELIEEACLLCVGLVDEESVAAVLERG